MADLNFSPDSIDNLIKILQNNTSSDISNNSQTKNSSTSSVDFNEIFKTFSSNVSEDNSSSQGTSNIDLETIMKMKSIMDSLNNSNNNDANLLYSLKPYLRKSRQAKLDQYINILKISQVSKIFKNEKGDLK